MNTITTNNEMELAPTSFTPDEIDAMSFTTALEFDVASSIDSVNDNIVTSLEMVGDAVDAIADKTIVITHWGKTWLGKAWNLWRNGGPPGVYAKQILDKLDSIDEEPEEFVETHTKEEIKTVVKPIFDKKTKMFVRDDVIREVRVKIVKKLKKGQRSNFAAAVAKHAYNKFGERPHTEANVLVTRRWLQKYFDDAKFTDLRTVDKNMAIDRALFLSFVPTRDFQKSKIATATRQWQKRMDSKSAFAGFWTTVFGVGTVGLDADELC
jgi:hypothetical protein